MPWEGIATYPTVLTMLTYRSVYNSKGQGNCCFAHNGLGDWSDSGVVLRQRSRAGSGKKRPAPDSRDDSDSDDSEMLSTPSKVSYLA